MRYESMAVPISQFGFSPEYLLANYPDVMKIAFAVKLGPDGVNVNCISPGYIKTPMQDYQTEQSIQMSREQTLLPDLGEPDEVATVVAFLASEAASYVHGANVYVDGGWTAHRV